MASQFGSAIAALVLAAVVLLAWGGVRTLPRDRTKGVLMLVCALVILGNLLIWTV
jgi:hypothetical protein